MARLRPDVNAVNCHGKQIDDSTVEPDRAAVDHQDAVAER
jgi:hypothetical protein